MDTLWIYYGYSMDILWIYYGYSMDTLWIYYGFSDAIANSIVWISLFFSGVCL
jgi:hypothetical protein